MDTVLVIPCFNEETRLSRQKFADAIDAQPGLRLLFVDDGSEDRTLELLHSMSDQFGGRVSVLALPRNVGKAEAVRAGVRHALGEAPEYADPSAVGYWDADLSTSLEELPRFRKVLESSPAALAAIGSRVRLAGRYVERSALRHYGGRVFATGAAMALGFAVYDTQCGGKLFRAGPTIREAFELPFLTRWAFDVELLARLRSLLPPDDEKRDIIVEVPLQEWRDVPGSKVRLSDTPRMVLDLWRIYREYRGGSGRHSRRVGSSVAPDL